jgi:hypothetical protein
MPAARRLIPLLLGLLAACGGSDPSGPGTGSLALAIVGLPAGTPATVTVTGPGGYSHLTEGSETLSGLVPGAYAVEAEAVSGNGQNYQPVQSLQSVTVAEGATAATAQITYGATGTSLGLTISGLPPGTAGSVTVTGPNGYNRPVTATTTLSGLEAGVYTVAAQSVSSAGSQYDPSPGTQNVNVPSGATASASVGYTPASAAGLNLRIDGMYLTQSVQTYDGEVPLVKDRDGFLRVFVTATQSNLAAPSVRVRFAVSGVLTKDTMLGANGLSVPLSPNEGSLSASWNMPVPGALIQPNLTILAEVDPANTVAETNESDNLFPSAGTPLALEVRPTSTFAVRFVSIRQTANGLQGDVTNTNKATYLGATMRMHPLAAYDADVRATPLSTDAAAVQADNSTAWTQILNELKAARTSDGSSRYYYGVVKPSYSSGIAGIGYVGVPVAIGWDKPGADQVAAHEWGHNWSRQHAPCGAAGNPDLSYPYANGAIGVYGFDVGARIIKPPTYADLMGYCNNEWISDYTYTSVMDFRGTHADVESAFAQAMQPCLLVWGRIVDGQPVLEPAFQVVTRPSLPAAPGPYSVEGSAADGSSIFRVSFAPDPVADDPAAGAQFAFAVPLQPDRAERVVAMHLVERGRPIASVRASAGAVPATAGVEARPLGGGRVGLRWDASAHPMLMVRDPVTGEVLSFARGGRSEIVTDRGELDLQLSTGVRGRSMRLSVQRR